MPLRRLAQRAARINSASESGPPEKATAIFFEGEKAEIREENSAALTGETEAGKASSCVLISPPHNCPPSCANSSTLSAAHAALEQQQRERPAETSIQGRPRRYRLHPCCPARQGSSRASAGCQAPCCWTHRSCSR